MESMSCDSKSSSTARSQWDKDWALYFLSLRVLLYTMVAFLLALQTNGRKVPASQHLANVIVIDFLTVIYGWQLVSASPLTPTTFNMVVTIFLQHFPDDTRCVSANEG
jgi:uncharacterized membrane protein